MHLCCCAAAALLLTAMPMLVTTTPTPNKLHYCFCLRLQMLKGEDVSYGGALMPGEGAAIAQYVRSLANGSGRVFEIEY